MKKQMLPLVLLLSALPLSVQANGGHLGWCIGTNNPHGAAGCSSGGGTSTATGLTGGVTGSVPSANQLPGTGTAAIPAQGPAIITVQPLPQTVITNYGTVPTVQGQMAPSVVGNAPLPIVLQPIPQPVLTGVGTVPQPQAVQSPSFTGVGKPPVIVQPLPLASFTGTGPVPSVQTVPTPSFTGQGLPTIIVVPQPPVMIGGLAPVSAAIIVQPNPNGGFAGVGAVPVPTPTPSPNQIPAIVPNAVPQAIPPMVPGRITSQPGSGAAQYTMVQRPTPQPKPTSSGTSAGRIDHAPRSVEASIGHSLVTRNSGRQSAHDAPRFATAAGGNWNCLASGHGKRTSYADREAEVSGALRHVGAVDVLGRDLPAVHPRHAGCVIAVKRRRD